MESYKETVIETDSIVLDVVKEFGLRAEVGFKKYGTNMDRKDLSVSDWLTHLTQEMMDGLLYITKLKKELKKLEDELAAYKNATPSESELKFYDGAEFVTYKYVTQPSKQNKD
jgi:hypothetical protein